MQDYCKMLALAVSVRDYGENQLLLELGYIISGEELAQEMQGAVTIEAVE